MMAKCFTVDQVIDHPRSTFDEFTLVFCAQATPIPPTRAAAVAAAVRSLAAFIVKFLRGGASTGS